MDYLQNTIYQLIKLGGLKIKVEGGKLDLALIIEEAVGKGILPGETIQEIKRFIEKK